MLILEIAQNLDVERMISKQDGYEFLSSNLYISSDQREDSQWQWLDQWSKDYLDETGSKLKIQLWQGEDVGWCTEERYFNILFDRQFAIDRAEQLWAFSAK